MTENDPSGSHSRHENPKRSAGLFPAPNLQPMMESRPVRDIAYEVLRCAIVSGEIPSGSRLVETEYAEKLHISRTPLREALQRLEKEGLVENRASSASDKSGKRGMVVKAFTVDDVNEIYTIRNALEMLTLPSIIENATAEDIAALRMKLHAMDEPMKNHTVEVLSPMARDFHSTLTGICTKRRVLAMLESQDEYVRRFSAMAIVQEDHLISAHMEHYRLVDLVEARDLQGFEELMRRHIERSRETCIAALASLPMKNL